MVLKLHFHKFTIRVQYMNYKLLLIMNLCLSCAIYASAPYPIKLQDVVREADKIAVFEVIEVDYIKKEMIFTATHRTKEDVTYKSKVLLTKYTLKVDQSIKNTALHDMYEIYSDGGIDVEAGEGVRSSIGFELREGEKVLVMFEYDEINDIYMPLYHNDTVFSMIDNHGEIILKPYSDMKY